MKKTIIKIIKKTSVLQFVFFALFLVLNLYYLVIKSELYESRTALLVKDLSSTSTASSLGLSLLGVGSSSQLQDSKIVEEYLKSLDMYLLLDEKFDLTSQYKSKKLDFVERLSSRARQEDFVKFYNSRLMVGYDEISGILTIAFSDVDPKQAKEIVSFLITVVETQINQLNHNTSKKKLLFVDEEYQKAKEKMDSSSKKLETYQNTHLLLDPATQATSTSGVISQLDTELIQKQIELSTMKNYLSENSYEIKAATKKISEIQKSIANQKKELSGTSKGRLNKILFEYEKLKLQLEFDIEVYKNTLLQLETTKIEVSKEAKVLSVISKPNLPDGYTYPNKPRVFITILIVILLMYGIFSMLIAIIKDHKE